MMRGELGASDGVESLTKTGDENARNIVRNDRIFVYVYACV